MTVTDQLKILDRKIMQNEAQYDLDRKAAKISALSSNNLDKYDYFNGEDLVLNQALLNKLNLSILHWVKFLIKGWIKMIKKKCCFRDSKILKVKMKR